jgi:hypothetical protein
MKKNFVPGRRPGPFGTNDNIFLRGMGKKSLKSSGEVCANKKVPRTYYIQSWNAIY